MRVLPLLFVDRFIYGMFPFQITLFAMHRRFFSAGQLLVSTFLLPLQTPSLPIKNTDWEDKANTVGTDLFQQLVSMMDVAFPPPLGSRLDAEKDEKASYTILQSSIKWESKIPAFSLDAADKLLSLNVVSVKCFFLSIILLMTIER